jgi:hypothetical protein
MSLFSSLRRRSWGPQASRKSRPRFRPRLEVLEGRLVPTILVVTTPADSGPGSLRAEIAAANSGDSIAFDAGLNGKAITLSSGELQINKDLSITGLGANSLTVSGNHASRVFHIIAGTVSLSGLTIASGQVANSGGGGILNEGTLAVTSCTFSGNFVVGGGGGVLNEGTLAVTSCTFSGNSAEVGGGGIANVFGTVTVTNCTVSGNSGGGISNDRGTAAVTNCTVAGNVAEVSGGGIDTFGGTLTVTNCTVTGNTAPFHGGGILNFGEGTLRVANSTLAGNVAMHNGGGIANFDGAVTVTNCTLAGNVAGLNGGGIDSGGTLSVTNTTLVDNSTISDSGEGGGIHNSGTLTVTDSAFSSNVTSFVGGGIANAAGMTVANCTFTNNSAPNGGGSSSGGGIYSASGAATVTSCGFMSNSAADDGGGIANGGTLTVTSCTFAGNAAGGAGGGLYTTGTATVSGCILTSNTAASGGGVFNAVGSASLIDCSLTGNSASAGGALFNQTTATLTDCTLAGNTASFFGGLENSSGASVSLSNSTLSSNTGGAIGNQGTASLTNCTVCGNTTNAGVDSTGGIDTSSLNSDASTTLLNCTVANNTNLAGGPGGLFAGRYGTGQSTVTLTNTIVAENAGSQFGTAGASVGPGTFVSQGYNLSSDSSGSLTQPGDLQNVNPLLAPLGNYGGPTQTLALLPGSPAIDAGSNALAVDAGNNPLTTDERGVARVVNGTVDIGAFESRPFTIALTSGYGQSTTVNNGFLNPLVVTVTSAYGDPVQGGVVTFAAPGSGAGATFPASGGGTATAMIDPVGQAAVAATANTVAGGYAVLASARGASFAAGFSLTNSPDLARTFVVSGFPSPTSAGAAHTIIVTAKDQYGNTATGYVGVVHFTSTDLQATLPADALLTNGIGLFSVALKTAGTQSVTATDALTATLTGTQSGITVNPSVAAAFIIAAPATVAPGVPFSFTVTAVDAYGNVATGYNGTIQLSSSDKKAVLPGNVTLTNGKGAFTATFKTKGPQTLTVTDVASSGLTDSLVILVDHPKK